MRVQFSGRTRPSKVELIGLPTSVKVSTNGVTRTLDAPRTNPWAYVATEYGYVASLTSFPVYTIEVQSPSGQVTFNPATHQPGGIDPSTANRLVMHFLNWVGLTPAYMRCVWEKRGVREREREREREKERKRRADHIAHRSPPPTLSIQAGQNPAYVRFRLTATGLSFPSSSPYTVQSDWHTVNFEYITSTDLAVLQRCAKPATVAVTCQAGNLTSSKTFGDMYSGCHLGIGVPEVTLFDATGTILSCDSETVVLAHMYAAHEDPSGAMNLIQGNWTDVNNVQTFDGPGYFTSTVINGVASFPNITWRTEVYGAGTDMILDFHVSKDAPTQTLLSGQTRFQTMPGSVASMVTQFQPDYGIGQVSVGLGENASSTVTIQDDGDAGTLGFANRYVYVTEASSSVTLTVTRTGSFNPTWPVAIYTAAASKVAATATRGVDWQFTEQLIYFYGTKTSEEITINLFNDALFEFPEEHFTLALVNGINSPGLHATNRFCTVVIRDDGDGGTFQFDPSTPTFTKVEQTGAQLTFAATILRSGRMNGEVTLNVQSFDAVSGPYNASAGLMKGPAMAQSIPASSASNNMGIVSHSDFVAINETVTFQTGESSKTITITVLDDDQFEIPEYFQVALTRASSNNTEIVRANDGNATGTNIGALDYITVAIRDDGDAGTVSFASADYEFVEYYNASNPSSRAQVAGVRWSPSLSLVRVGRDTTFDMAITISTVGGSGSGLQYFATGNADYVSETKTVTIARASTSSPFNVTILDDAVFEHPDESFLVVIDSVTNYPLANHSGGMDTLTVPAPESIGLTNKTRVLILDDVDAGTFSFSSANYSVAENGGVASLNVVRNKGDSDTVQVQYAVVAGTASGDDVTLETGNITFGNGVTQVPIVVRITQDNIFEYPDEEATVRLTGATCGFGG